MPHVPRRLRTLARKALRVNPAERFQTATEMADALSRVSLALDWTVQPILPKGFRWRAARLGCADVVVELAEEGGAWDVRTYTEKIGEPRRAKGKNGNLRMGLSVVDAHSHLSDLFEGLPG
jgi:hypothetical protein